MTQAERNKLYVARCLLDGKMSISEAAEVLGLSERQVKRIKKGGKEFGEAFVIHKNRGRKPPHALSDELKNLVVEHRKSLNYSRANFSHFQELLAENEDINLSKPSIYRILTENGFTSPKKHRKVKQHKRRKRKPQRGMLVIIDASPHDSLLQPKKFTKSFHLVGGHTILKCEIIFIKGFHAWKSCLDDSRLGGCSCLWACCVSRKRVRISIGDKLSSKLCRKAAG